MREIQHCLGLPLIALDTAEQVGVLAHFLSDPVRNRIQALVLSDGSGYGGKVACLFEDVMRFGPDAILLHSAASARPLPEIPELLPFLDPARDPFFRKAWTSDGQYLGLFTPHSFDDATARVSAFRLDPRDGGESIIVCHSAVVSSGKSLALFDRAALPLTYHLSVREAFEVSAATPLIGVALSEIAEAAKPLEVAADHPGMEIEDAWAAPEPFSPAPVEMFASPVETLPVVEETLSHDEEEIPQSVELLPLEEETLLEEVSLPVSVEVLPEPEDSFAALLEAHTESEWGAPPAPTGIPLTFEELLSPIPGTDSLLAQPEEAVQLSGPVAETAPAEDSLEHVAEGWNGILGSEPAPAPMNVVAETLALEEAPSPEEDLDPMYAEAGLDLEAPAEATVESQKVRDLFNGSKDEILPLIIGKVSDRLVTDLDGDPIVVAGQPISRKVAEAAWRSSKLYDLFIAAQPTNASYTA